MNSEAWILTGLSLAGATLNMTGSRKLLLVGYVVWIVANALWSVHYIGTGQTPQAVLFSVYFVLSLGGVWKWSRKIFNF